MPLKLIRKESNYYDFLINKDIDGICYGMCACWLMDVVKSGIKETGFPDTFSEIRMAIFYYVISGERQGVPAITKRMDILGKQLTWEAKGGTQKVKEYKAGDDVKNDMRGNLFNKGKNTAALLAFELADDSSHVVAFYHDKKTMTCYFYDPNVGLYEWSRGSNALFSDLKEHIDKTFTDDGTPTNSRLEAALYFTS